MIFADILFWFLMVAGAYLALNASWLAAVALFRPAVERAHETYATRRWQRRSPGWGRWCRPSASSSSSPGRHIRG